MDQVTDKTVTETPAPPPQAALTQDDVVPRHELKKTVDDVMKWKRVAQENERKLKTFEEQQLSEKQEWQKLAEMRGQREKELEEEVNRLKTTAQHQKKYDAVRNAAMRAGIRDISDIDTVALDEVVLEATSLGTINVHGAEDLVAKLKTQKPHWFGSPTAARVNASSPDVTGATPKTKNELYEEVKKQREHYKKTGDQAPFKKALEEYQKHSS